jgi:hypothetical protein
MGADTPSQSERIRNQCRVSPRRIVRELICGDGVVAKSPVNTGPKAGSECEAVGNRAGRFESDLSMVSIVDVYPKVIENLTLLFLQAVRVSCAIDRYSLLG